MKLTPKQRAKIYREAAERVFNSRIFGCIAIDDIIGETESTDDLELNFPEFHLFAPEERCYAFWMSYEYQERTLGLLLAEQIALNPIYK